jgi:hypothetical protein
MKALVIAAALAALIAAPLAHAQKDVGDPLEDFLATRGIGGTKRTVDEGVSRVAGDFNNDGQIDVALWQKSDFSRRTGIMHLYLARKDGRFAASGTIVVSAQTLFKPIPREKGHADLLVCERRGAAGEGSPRGYAIDGFIVTDLRRDNLPASCAGADKAHPMCREACEGDTPLEIERLDIERFRANGLQAWITR